MARLQKIDEAVNALISPDPPRREFQSHERLVATLYGAVKPDPAALEFAGRAACLATIAEAIRAKLNPDGIDISEVMGGIARVLDASIKGVEMPAKPAPVIDLSRIDFEALRLDERYRNRLRKAAHRQDIAQDGLERFAVVVGGDVWQIGQVGDRLLAQPEQHRGALARVAQLVAGHRRAGRLTAGGQPRAHRLWQE
jgi:hypothetical protein